MNFYKVNTILGWFWAILCIVTAIIAFREVQAHGFEQAKMYVFFPCVALAFFFKAFFMKKRLDRHDPKD